MKHSTIKIETEAFEKTENRIKTFENEERKMLTSMSLNQSPIPIPSSRQKLTLNQSNTSNRFYMRKKGGMRN